MKLAIINALFAATIYVAADVIDPCGIYSSSDNDNFWYASLLTVYLCVDRFLLVGVPWNSVDRVIATKVADIACLPCSASQVLKVAPRMDHHVLPGHLPIRHAQVCILECIGFYS